MNIILNVIEVVLIIVYVCALIEFIRMDAELRKAQETFTEIHNSDIQARNERVKQEYSNDDKP